MKRLIAIFIITISLTPVMAQTLNTENVILVTLDGLRWQEVFEGADESILFNESYVSDKSVMERFWSEDKNERRKLLLPFFWESFGKTGQLYGNRNHRNFVNCSNHHLFSYPGYSEMLVGFVDRKIKSNDPIENHNPTVLEFIEKEPGFNGKVAAFATWEIFSYILREKSANLYVNAGHQPVLSEDASERELLLNELQDLLPNPHGARYDAFTFYYAFEYLKRERPRVLMISFDETDQHGHGGRYDEYLKSAHKTDGMLARLWEWVQSDPMYKDKTTLIVTTDHGRGKGKNNWRNHGFFAFGSGQIWLGVLGPDTPPDGEMRDNMRLFQKQVAATMAALLELDYSHKEQVGEVIEAVIEQPQAPVTALSEK